MLLVMEDGLRQDGAPAMADFMRGFIGKLSPGVDPDRAWWKYLLNGQQRTSSRAIGISDDLADAIDNEVDDQDLYMNLDWEPDNDGDFLVGFGLAQSVAGGQFQYPPMFYMGRGYVSSLSVGELSAPLVERILNEGLIDKASALLAIEEVIDHHMTDPIPFDDDDAHIRQDKDLREAHAIEKRIEAFEEEE